MSPIAFLGAAAALVLATGSAALIVRGFGIARRAGRYDSIDGLRGYLALFVFLHHSAIWYLYSRTGRWEAPPSNLFTLFGEAGVALFFMITGFLFSGKLLDGSGATIDWTRLYVSRVLRLVPLYGFAMLLLFVIVGERTGWLLREPVGRVLAEAAAWLGFTIRGNPDLNGLKETLRIVAGVTWSLPYEWFFYFSLPLLGVFLRVRPSAPYLVLSLLACLAVLAGGWRPAWIHAGAFVGGIVAAALVRREEFRKFATGPASTGLAVVSIALLIGLFPSANSSGATALLTVLFSLIAGGCTLFGTLVTPASRLLGDIAYSVYMLHGIALYLLLDARFRESLPLSPSGYWTIVVGLTPVLVAACFATYRLIEKPAMDRVPSIVKRLKFPSPLAPADDEERPVLPLS